MKKLKKFWKVLKSAGSGFVNDNAFKLSAALSYYTVFALAPMLVIIISLTGIFLGKEAMQGNIYKEIKDVVGSEAALQLQQIIVNIEAAHSGTTGAIVGAVLLFVGATGVFTEMQDSINFIWSVKAKPKKSWLRFIINRLLSFSLIISIGFVLLVSLVINAVLNLLSDRLLKLLPHYTVYLFHVLNMAIIVVAITILFTIIFKVLPDAVIAWKDAVIGAFFTALLFLLGKFLITYYIGSSNMGATYGAAASIVIILTWVYYSAIILYFGAEFTKMYALHTGEGIRPKPTAVFIIKREAREVPLSTLQS
ncbi:YihY/virulence factor BrkB family protein [Paraflavisolibacter sp. H34]|uniref:YihY/virulence factor BrkB family protein n=1 Tax=Huijunlia imazamoxiresistens TaxID=3127457 RepID=UPI003016BA41